MKILLLLLIALVCGGCKTMEKLDRSMMDTESRLQDKAYTRY